MLNYAHTHTPKERGRTMQEALAIRTQMNGGPPLQLVTD